MEQLTKHRYIVTDDQILLEQVYAVLRQATGGSP